jgi:hypothetical protein
VALCEQDGDTEAGESILRDGIRTNRGYRDSAATL